ncbi:MAG: ATP-binding protein [Alphaproteobacteria bacterium]|nr:ATP-binding protein [Alphaproteobacteria bacterium]
MLLEFSVSNYRSVLERQTLSLVASHSRDHEESHVYTPEGKQPRVVRSAVIYGPNAAGKSNLIQAAAFAQTFIIASALLQEGQPINVTPFALSQRSSREPSEFEFLFVEDGVRYHYGFALNSERVVREWLVAYPKGKQRWFEREYDADAGKYAWTLGDHFRGERAQKNTWRDSTRSNALFLSAAVQLNNEQLRPIFGWFQNKLGVVTLANSFNRLLSTELLRDPERKHLLDQFIRAADVGIEQLEYREERIQNATVININLAGAAFPVSNAPTPTFPLIGQVIASHKLIDGDGIAKLNFDFAESDGTKKLFEYAGAWIKALNEGATLLVDELDRSLHPLMTRFLVQLFHDQKRNVRGAQLIFTTHDTTLLDAKFIRRDQVWFVEKDQNSSTHLYSLLEYSPRADEALERGYLKGRYGAIPFLSPLNFDA